MKIIIVLAACVLTTSAAPRGGPVGADYLCGICTSLVGAAENLGIQDATQLENMVKPYCQKLPFNWLASLCVSAVDALIPDLLNYIKNDLPPQTVCADVGLCSSMMTEAQVGGALFCSVCEDLVQEAENLGVNSESALDALVGKFCDKLSFLSGVCKGAIDGLVKDLLTYITQHLPPATVCAKVHLCSSMVEESQPAPKTLPDLCGVCQDFVGTVEADVNDGQLQQQLDAACAKWFPLYTSYCKMAISLVLPQIKKMIASAGSPAQVCQEVRLCKSRLVAADLSESVRSGPFCQYCEMGINTVKQLLENYVPNVVNDVEGLCNKLPGEEGQICTMLVKNYLQMLMDKLIGMLDADKVCAAMKLCDGTSTVTRQTGAVALAQLDINWGTVECNFCKMLFEFLENNLLGDNVEQSIFQGLEKICQDLPNQSYQQTCIDILGSYGPMIINYLKSLISPDHVCPIIKMCS